MADEFLIHLDNPTKIYFPGQNVSGCIVISGSTERKTKGITVHFSGNASVYWTETRTEYYYERDADGRDVQRTRYYTESYSAGENYFNYQCFAFGDGRNATFIPPGRNIYPFNFPLPPNLPSSFKGEHGSVGYELSATLEKAWAFDKDIKQSVLMNGVLDLRRIPRVALPFEDTASKHFCCCCCASGPVGFTVHFQKTGFVPGEAMSARVELFNDSGRTINGISLCIVQRSNYFAQGHSNSQTASFSGIQGPGVEPHGTSTWAPTLQIPKVQPTNLGGGIRIIELAYFAEFELEFPGMSSNLKQFIPITIGTIPCQAVASSMPQTGYAPEIPVNAISSTDWESGGYHTRSY